MAGRVGCLACRVLAIIAVSLGAECVFWGRRGDSKAEKRAFFERKYQNIRLLLVSETRERVEMIVIGLRDPGTVPGTDRDPGTDPGTRQVLGCHAQAFVFAI